MKQIVGCIAVLIISLSVFANENNIAQISLLTETNDISEPFYIGIYFDMEPDWYIYWENPGDAGVPVDVRWDIPEGFTISELIYPTPERFDTQGLISFGFKDEALLLAKITPASIVDGRTNPVISVEASWMVCKESCILEDGAAELNLNECEPSPEIFNRYKNKIPESLDRAPTRITSVESRKEQGRIYIIIQLEGDPVHDFFPGPVTDFILSHKDIEVNDHSISYTLRPYSESSAVSEVSGLLFINGTAYQFNEPVSMIIQ